MDKGFREKIVWLSLILAIGVVVRHTINYRVYGLSSGLFVELLRWLDVATDLIVSTFFILSGYLFFCNFDYGELGCKWRSRFFTLVIPYVIWNLVAYFYYEAITSLPIVARSMNKAVEPFTAYWLLHNALWADHNITWFIRHLIVYVYTIPLLYFILRKSPWAVSFLVLALIAVAARCCSYFVCLYLTYGVMFALGGVIGIHGRDVAQKIFQPGLHVFALAWLVATTVLQMQDALPSVIVTDFYVPLRVTQSIAIWILADGLIKLPPPRGGHICHLQFM